MYTFGYKIYTRRCEIGGDDLHSNIKLNLKNDIFFKKFLNLLKNEEQYKAKFMNEIHKIKRYM